MNSRQAINLLKDLEQSLDDYCELNDEGKAAFRMAITALELFGNAEQLPSAQPERKKGKWTKDCACEICGFKPWYERDIHTLSFCPNCGADMREDQDG